MTRVLLALADLALGVQLQETLEAHRVQVRWDPTAADGPPPGLAGSGQVEDVVVVDADGLGSRLGDVLDAWRGLDPAPGVIALGGTQAAAGHAADARVTLVSPTDDAATLLEAAQEALRLRFAGSMTRGLARRALLVEKVADPIADAAQIVGAARAIDVEIPREALRWHARSYVCGDPATIAALREVRALTIPEVEFSHHLDGTFTVQTLVKRGPIDAWHAARFIWALTSVGAAKITREPLDLATPRRRALALIRQHLRGRQARLEKSTFYDILEITPAAETEDIEAAYELVGRRYAPQVLGAFDLGELGTIVEPMWAQVEKARSVMHDISARGRYNDWLRGRWNEIRTRWAIETSAAQTAVESYARGQRALGDGDVHRAVGDLAAAARNHTGHPEYEAGLAWARYRVEAGRDGADRAAIARRERASAEAAMWGTRPWPRANLALALLCAADGDPDSARWHLQEALAIDPNLPAAQQLLARLNRR
ncbi:MAG: tetratricopeptide repeat protein [Kofleriaceae bacterium]|nr:tetratricopeptide repeat protein [Kofleriaceae bacterium]MCB9575213.1 tetratricopeptide repeat protein [Kofleriaceae bacterium]